MFSVTEPSQRLFSIILVVAESIVYCIALQDFFVANWGGV